MYYKALAEEYAIPEDYAILLEATWHRQTPDEGELRECKYSHDLPEGIAEFLVIATARRALKHVVKLQEVVDRLSKLEITPNRQIILALNELLKTSDLKWETPTEKRRYFLEIGKVGFQTLKHAAIYQQKIVEDELNGIFPRKLPEIIEQVNLVNLKAGQ